MKYFWRALLVLLLFGLQMAVSAASLEVSEINDPHLIQQFEKLASLKGQSSQEVQLAFGKATQNLLTYLVPDIKKLNDFNAMFFINCTVFFDSNDVNKIKCDVDFSAINPDNQTDPGAIILRENIKQLRNDNIFMIRTSLNCSSDEYLLGTNELYFKQPWDWTRTVSQSRIERSKTASPTISESYTEIQIPSKSISDTSTVSYTSNIWSISNCQKLQNISQSLNGNFILANDIDCSDTKNWNNGAGFIPIGTFGGIIDGNNYTIFNLHINNTNKVTQIGLFACVGGTAIIRNVMLVNVSINSSGGVAVALIGMVKAGGQVDNVHVVGNVTVYNADANMAGLVGILNPDCKIINSSFVGVIAITGKFLAAIGGLVGYHATNSVIVNSYAIGTIITHSSGGSGQVGGLVGSFGGESFKTGILNSYASVNVNGSGSIGGLVGSTSGAGIIQNSYATGNVNAQSEVGGLIGSDSFDEPYNTAVKNCYSIGSVKGVYIAGGLIGSSNGQLYNITSSYWDTETSGQQTSAGGKVKLLKK